MTWLIYHIYSILPSLSPAGLDPAEELRGFSPTNAAPVSYPGWMFQGQRMGGHVSNAKTFATQGMIGSYPGLDVLYSLVFTRGVGIWVNAS